MESPSRRSAGSTASVRHPALLAIEVRGRGRLTLFRTFNAVDDHNREGLSEWALKNKIKPLHTRSGHPTRNAFIERFNGTARYEWLEMRVFGSVDEVRTFATEWL